MCGCGIPCCSSSCCTLFFLFFLISTYSLVVAGVWFAIGSEGWRVHYNMNDDETRAFIVSLHWAVSTFTLGSTEVAPTTSTENAVAVIIQFLNLVTVFPMSLTLVLEIAVTLLPDSEARGSLLGCRAFIFLIGLSVWILVVGGIASVVFETDDDFLTYIYWALSVATPSRQEVMMVKSWEYMFAILVQVFSLVTAYPLLVSFLFCLHEVRPGCCQIKRES